MTAVQLSCALAEWSRRLRDPIAVLEHRLEPDELPRELAMRRTRRVLRVTDRPGFVIAPTDAEWVALGQRVDPLPERPWGGASFGSAGDRTDDAQTPEPATKRRTLSPDQRARISAAARKRWAEQPRKLSAEHRARLSAAARKSWRQRKTATGSP